jgi:hypothetical protein
VVTRAALALALVAAGCQAGEHGEPAATTTAPTGSAKPPADVAKAAHADAAEVSPPPPPDEPEQVAANQISELGAVPAWQAVVDRGHYLARRGEHGVVYGTLGAAIMEAAPAAASGPGDAGVIDAGLVASPYSWLVDDTEGNGCLAIRVAFAGKAGAVKAGDRIAVDGAWALDDRRDWYWKAGAITPLPAAPPSGLAEPAVAPGHTIANGELPNGARTIGVAKDGDAVYFTVVGTPPATDGDGWQVADELGSPVVALMNMPGERASYGAQDLRSADERWHLRRGQTYWVRIGHLHKHGDKPTTVNARTAPVRVK